jgi:bifunctional non-homologous end joining protein LigD
MEFAGRRVWCLHSRGRRRWLGIGRVRAGVLDEIGDELAGLRCGDSVIDGVLVALDDQGRPGRGHLDGLLSGEVDAEPFFYGFDLLRFDGLDLGPLPLVERRSLLAAIWPAGARHAQVVEPVLGDGERLAERAAAAGLGALVAKRAASPYEGGRSRDWRRVVLRPLPGAVDVPFAEALAAARAVAPSTRVRFTNRQKIYWPDEGYTKGDLLDYYEAVAEHLLPFLHDRPVHMRRFPDGITGESFYQRQAPEGTPEWVRTVELPISHDPGEVGRHVVCEDRDTLLWLVNLGSIDLHPWLSRCETPEVPDWIVFDLDPKGAPFSDVVKVARALGRVLRGIELRPLVKTSGSTGVHVVLPLVPEFTYEQVSLFAEGVARVVARELRDIATVERALEHRRGRVYIDVLQNRRGQTVVPPWVVRPVPGATASTPLDWDELESGLSPEAFHLRSVPARIAERADPFRAAHTDLQDFRPAISRLEEYVRSG